MPHLTLPAPPAPAGTAEPPPMPPSPPVLLVDADGRATVALTTYLQKLTDYLRRLNNVPA